MPTEIWYFKGTGKWCKIKEPDPKFKNYEVNLYMDEEQKERYKSSGISNEFRSDEDGEYITFRRPDKKLIKDELVTFGPPDIIYEGGKYDGLIGNGSQLTVKVSVYDTSKGKGSRMETIRIDDLVTYEGGPKVHDDGIDSPF